MIKVILSSITRIGLIIYIKDSEEPPSVNHIYIKEDIKVKEITVIDITTTSYLIRSNTIFLINLEAN